MEMGVKAELFPTEVRALGVGLPYAIANAMFGGTAEYVALWLKSAAHEQWFFWYVAGMAAIAFAASLIMPTRANTDISRGLDKSSAESAPRLLAAIRVGFGASI